MLVRVELGVDVSMWPTPAVCRCRRVWWRRGCTFPKYSLLQPVGPSLGSRFKKREQLAVCAALSISVSLSATSVIYRQTTQPLTWTLVAVFAD